MPNLFSYPSTLAAAQDTKSRQIKVLQDNVHLNLDAAPRTFATGDIVNLSDHEYAGIAASAFTGDYLIDRGRVVAVADDAALKVIEIPLVLADIADGTVSGFLPGFDGEIKKVEFITTDPASTAAKATTLNLAIAGQNLGTNEKVTLTEGGSGLTSFTLTFGGQTTASLDDDATAAQVQAALEALSTIGADNVVVSAGPLGTQPFMVEFVGALGGTNVGAITTTPTGGTGTVTAVVDTPGLTTTLSLTTVACDTEGEVISSANAFTTLNATFGSGQEITVEASSTTAFAQGRGVVRITVQAA